MNFIVNKPGLSLIIVGVASFFLRFPVGSVPGVGGVLRWVLLLAAIFFVIAGTWMAIVGRGSD